MMDNLKSSRFIYIWGEGLRRQGWFGRIAVLTQVAGIVLMPRIHIRYGEVSEAEIKKFPHYLKRLLKIYAGMLVVALLWGGIAVVMLNFKC
jgi:hypothetical protein